MSPPVQELPDFIAGVMLGGLAGYGLGLVVGHYTQLGARQFERLVRWIFREPRR